MVIFLKRHQIALTIIVDSVAIAAAFFYALELRFEFAPPSMYLMHFAFVLPLVIFVFLISFSLLGVYKRKWKFASLDEIWAIARGTVFTAAALFLSLLLIPGFREFIPASVALSGAAIALLALCAFRASIRLIRDIRTRRTNRVGIKVLLVGAGEAGEMIARDMLRNPEYGYTPRAFVDDNPRKRHLILQGVPVSGSRGDIPEIVDELGIDEIFMTMPSAQGIDIREIVDICGTTRAKVKILPGMTRVLQEDPGLSSVRELRVEDLLGREPVEIDLDLVSGYLSGKVVLVTGAAGSIGSELCREILRFDPARLVLLDNDETALFNLQFDLQAVGEQFEMVVADIREEKRIRGVFERYRPAIVFHSAALKHVPMMELHPCEAVKNNIEGTLNLARAAADLGCERFLLISTDKAVQPSSTMGATKRLSELLMKRYNKKSNTAFGAVRFGNVLGSRGSVVPVFEGQIKRGGPVLVTDPEITRYFMTINEAAQLVIQAGAYLHDGELFILDMGEPIRILELAKKMIAIMSNGKPIDIQFTGLRPGEKLHEELAYRYEELSVTVHPKISTINDHNGLPEELYSGMSVLIDCARQEQEEESKELLMDLVSLANDGTRDDPVFEMHEKYLAEKAKEYVREDAWTRSEPAWQVAASSDSVDAYL